MKIKVVLDNGGGELASEAFEVADDHDDQAEAINEGASKIVEGWILSAGDTITIREV